jgi:hypothetical protein
MQHKTRSRLLSCLLVAVIATLFVLPTHIRTAHAASVVATTPYAVLQPEVQIVPCDFSDNSQVRVAVYNEDTGSYDTVCYNGTGILFPDEQIGSVYAGQYEIALYVAGECGPIIIEPGDSAVGPWFVEEMDINPGPPGSVVQHVSPFC